MTSLKENNIMEYFNKKKEAILPLTTLSLNMSEL